MLYAVIIIGIFILQFKNDSLISDKIGALRISLAETQTSDNTSVLKNRMQVVFNGISFYANDDKPAQVTSADSDSAKKVSLISWKKTSDLSCEFLFTDNVRLQFAVSDSTNKAHLTVATVLPLQYTSFTIPYELSVGSSIVEQSDTHIAIGSKKSKWELSAAKIDDTRITFNQETAVASYSYFNKAKTFSFDAVNGIDEANATAYASSISSFKQNLINAFKALPSDTATVSEQEAVSFVAAMAEKGQYNEALDAVPQSFKKDSKRTYLSAPYFDTLAAVYPTLEHQMETFRDTVSSAVTSGTYTVFTIRNLSDYLCMHPGSDSVQKLLSSTAAVKKDALSLSEASGILHVYAELNTKNKTLASLLAPAAAACIERISSVCALDGSRLTIAENGTFVPVAQGVEAGDAILQCGKASGDETLTKAGYLLLESYLSDSASFDLRTLADLYPVIIHNNPMYPHFAILSFDSGEASWAWTCATSLKYAKDSLGSITLTIDFPQEYTHYIIVNGIKAFSSIYIYEMAFRTDPQFETYNSSGYVFLSSKNTLLLKSRHKSEIETVRLLYSTAAKEAEESKSFTETDSNGTPVAPEKPAPAASDSDLPAGTNTESD